MQFGPFGHAQMPSHTNTANRPGSFAWSLRPVQAWAFRRPTRSADDGFLGPWIRYTPRVRPLHGKGTLPEDTSRCVRQEPYHRVTTLSRNWKILCQGPCWLTLSHRTTSTRLVTTTYRLVTHTRISMVSSDFSATYFRRVATLSRRTLIWRDFLTAKWGQFFNNATNSRAASEKKNVCS